MLRSTYREFWDDQATFVASGVAFRVALAIFPGIALLLWLGTRVLGPDEAQAVIASLSASLPDAARQIIGSAVRSSVEHNPVDQDGRSLLGGFAPVFGLLFAIWSTNSGMEALFDALNLIYDQEERRGALRIYAVTLAFTFGALLLLAAMTALFVVGPLVLPHLHLPETARFTLSLARWPIGLVTIALALSLLFRYAPNRTSRDWPLVTVGSASAAILLILASTLFTWFVDRFTKLSLTYGSLSTMVSFLLWLWTCFVLLLACAELDSCIEAETGLYGSGRKRPAGTSDRSEGGR